MDKSRLAVLNDRIEKDKKERKDDTTMSAPCIAGYYKGADK